MAPAEVDAATGEVTCVLEERGRPVGDAAIAKDFAIVVRNAAGTSGIDAGCRRVRTVDEVGTTAVKVVPAPDGSRRAAFLSGRTARIIAIPSGRELLQLEHPGGCERRLRR